MQFIQARSARLSIGAGALLAAICVPGIALADWQNTNWSMSAAEVVRVTGARPVQGTPGDRVMDSDLAAVGSYSAMGFEFESRFYFDAADRLRVVKLVMPNPDRCDELRRVVSGIYGQPVQTTRNMSWLWIDADSGDRVRFTDARLPPTVDECFIVYEPALGSGARGL